MKVWITRTEPGASTLAEALAAAGHDVVKAPVLGIKPLPFTPPGGRFDLGLFLSVHAVRRAADLAHQIDSFHAVGRQTQAALRTLGFDAAAPTLETSEGLLQTLPDPAGKRVAIVTGSGGRDWLDTALTIRGARVTRLEVYVRYPLTPLVEAGNVNAIVVSSSAGFAQAARLWLAGGGNPDVPVVVPSARVAALAAHLGMRSVHDGRGADAQAVGRMLDQLANENTQ